MKLFEPISIKGMTIKNRIIMPPMGNDLGLRSRRARAYYAERARGGAGAVIIPVTSVSFFASDEPWQAMGRTTGAADFIDSLHGLVNDVHQAGAKIGIQLWHTNEFPFGIHVPGIKSEWVAPSRRVEPTPPSLHYIPGGQVLRELTIREIESIVNDFGKAAAGAKEAGFDFVEFHGAHGHLGHQFFSPLYNQRTDVYGGDLSGRMRFGLECVKSMRKAVGNHYPIFYRLGAVDHWTGGLTLEDSLVFAPELEKAGVDCLDVSVGINNRLPYRFYVSPSKLYPMGTFVYLAEAIKKKVKVPVIAVGRINTPEVAEKILTSGQADLVAIGRQLITDPFWPKKVLEGRVSEIVACTCCNTNCFEGSEVVGLVPPGSSLCRLNKRAGKEWEIPALA